MKVEISTERKQGVANDVRINFGKWYGHNISEVCKKDPSYVVFLMSVSSIGSGSANDNLLSCQSYIDKYVDWKSIKKQLDDEANSRAQKAIPVGTEIEFEGECAYREKRDYERVASWLPQEDQDRLNFDCIMIYCDNGLVLKVSKRLKTLHGRVKGTAVIDWYGSKSNIYGIKDVKVIKHLS